MRATDDHPPSDLQPRLARLTTRARRAVLRRRRLLAAVCAAVAVAAGLRAYAAPPPPTTEVVVAARDLAAGTVLGEHHLSTVSLPPEAAPAAALRDPAGQTLAAPLAAGEPVTRVRVVGDGLTAGAAHLVATPLRLPDAGMVSLLQPGDLIDLVGTDARGADAATLASGVPVLAVPEADAGGPNGSTGRLVVVGLERASVTRVTAAATATIVSFTWASR